MALRAEGPRGLTLQGAAEGIRQRMGDASGLFRADATRRPGPAPSRSGDVVRVAVVAARRQLEPGWEDTPQVGRLGAVEPEAPVPDGPAWDTGQEVEGTQSSAGVLDGPVGRLEHRDDPKRRENEAHTLDGDGMPVWVAVAVLGAGDRAEPPHLAHRPHHAACTAPGGSSSRMRTWRPCQVTMSGSGTFTTRRYPVTCATSGGTGRNGVCGDDGVRLGVRVGGGSNS